MKFLVDAHLPMRLVYWLRERGHDVIHTRELQAVDFDRKWWGKLHSRKNERNGKTLTLCISNIHFSIL